MTSDPKRLDYRLGVEAGGAWRALTKAECDEVVSELAKLRKENEALRDSVVRLNQGQDALRAQLEAAEKRAKEADAEIERLREDRPDLMKQLAMSFELANHRIRIKALTEALRMFTEISTQETWWDEVAEDVLRADEALREHGWGKEEEA